MSEPLTIYSRTWPRHFLADYERIGEALWLFLWLLTRADPASWYFRGSFEHVAEEIGMGVVQLTYWLERLEREGYLADESLDGKMVVKVEG